MTVPAFVQAKTNGGEIGYGIDVDMTLALDAAPTAGNTLVMQVIWGQPVDVEPSWPGWTLIRSEPIQNGWNQRLFMRAVGVGESATIVLGHSAPGIYGTTLMANLCEYSGLGGLPVASGAASVHWGGPATSQAFPAQIPAAGVPVLIIGTEWIDPNYGPAWPAGWSKRVGMNFSGDRFEIYLGDRIVASPDGTTNYSGVLSPAGAETNWELITAQLTGLAGGPGAQIVVV